MLQEWTVTDWVLDYKTGTEIYRDGGMGYATPCFHNLTSLDISLHFENEFFTEIFHNTHPYVRA